MSFREEETDSTVTEVRTEERVARRIANFPWRLRCEGGGFEELGLSDGARACRSTMRIPQIIRRRAGSGLRILPVLSLCRTFNSIIKVLAPLLVGVADHAHDMPAGVQREWAGFAQELNVAQLAQQVIPLFPIA